MERRKLATHLVAVNAILDESLFNAMDLCACCDTQPQLVVLNSRHAFVISPTPITIDFRNMTLG